MKTMDLTKWQKIAKYLEELKSLDASISEVEKMAELISNGEVECSFKVKVKDLSPKPEKEDILDGDGSLRKSDSGGMSSDDILKYMRQIQFGGWGFVSGVDSPSKPTNEHSLKQELAVHPTLKILAIILLYKQQEKQYLLNQIKKMGVEI